MVNQLNIVNFSYSFSQRTNLLGKLPWTFILRTPWILPLNQIDHGTLLLKTFNGMPSQSRTQSPYHDLKALDDLACCRSFDLIFYHPPSWWEGGSHMVLGPAKDMHTLFFPLPGGFFPSTPLKVFSHFLKLYAQTRLYLRDLPWPPHLE